MDTMKLLDEEKTGELTQKQLQNSFVHLEIEISQVEFEYLVQKLFELSKDIEKLEYNLAFDIFVLTYISFNYKDQEKTWGIS